MRSSIPRLGIASPRSHLRYAAASTLSASAACAADPKPADGLASFSRCAKVLRTFSSNVSCFAIWVVFSQGRDMGVLGRGVWERATPTTTPDR